MSIEKSAFEFVECVEEVCKTSVLEELFAKYVGQFGVQYFICAQLVFPGRVVKPTRLFGDYDAEWFGFYDQNHLYLDDPVVSHLYQTRSPFSWSWLSDNLELNRSEAFVMNEPRNFGLAEGVTFPIHGLLGSMAGLTVAGEYFSPNNTEMVAIQLMANYAYRRAVIIGGVFENVSSVNLSQRQRECLNWVQYGKSDRDIGQILGISPNTVKEHVEAAKNIFGVRTRVEAVVQARRAQLIRL